MSCVQFIGLAVDKCILVLFVLDVLGGLSTWLLIVGFLFNRCGLFPKRRMICALS